MTSTVLPFGTLGCFSTSVRKEDVVTGMAIYLQISGRDTRWLYVYVTYEIHN